MRKFNKIAVLIEKYNKAFGAITFLGVVGGAMHYSFLGYQVFKTSGTTIYLQQTTASVIFLWFAGFMSTCASVHRKVSKIHFFLQNSNALTLANFMVTGWEDRKKLLATDSTMSLVGRRERKIVKLRRHKGSHCFCMRSKRIALDSRDLGSSPAPVSVHAGP